jgi:class 3 adenylate cyclase
VHTGECELADGRLRGAPLEIAAGLAAAAQPGEVLASSTVHDLVAGSGVSFAERGAVAVPLDGRVREWRVFAVAR